MLIAEQTAVLQTDTGYIHIITVRLRTVSKDPHARSPFIIPLSKNITSIDVQTRQSILHFLYIQHQHSDRTALTFLRVAEVNVVLEDGVKCGSTVVIV